ncbi:MAG: hypothetical protein B6D68_04170 [spirochete symbiont of Stewartia floridana]|nr:MAG: hypothetical protein B6D68_04170 [spirochete symbiont of Stewartia floridana]
MICDPRRNIITALIAGRAVNPQSKLAAFRAISGPNRTSTLADTAGLGEDLIQRDIYEALDWLLMRQNAIEKKLADRHLKNGSFVLYDLKFPLV